MIASLRRTWGVMLKEVREVRRDIRSLSLLLLLPALMIMLYGYALTFDVKHIATVVLDQDRTADSREFTDGLFRSEYFDLVGTITRLSDADDWLNTGKSRVVMVIPRDFGERVRRLERVSVQMLIDGTNSNSANTAIGYLNGMVMRYTIAKTREALAARGLKQPPQLITIEPRVWYNPTLESSRFLIPGVIGFILMLVGVVATALSVVKEKERGTMEQIRVSPVKSGEFIVGKTLPYLLICLLTTVLTLVVSIVFFDMPVMGSWWWLFISTVVFLLGGLGFGLFVSTIAETQQVAFLIALIVTMLPSMILSGLIFPIASMPEVLQWITYIIPPRHYITILRGIMLKGTGVGTWTMELLILTAFAGAMMVIASIRLHRQRVK
jgi:ABC-2 type transport system permease protein